MSKVLVIHGYEPHLGLAEYLRLLPGYRLRELACLYHVALPAAHETTLIVFIDAAGPQGNRFPLASGPLDFSGSCLRVAYLVMPVTLMREMTSINQEPAMVHISALLHEGHRSVPLLRLVMTITVEWRALLAFGKVRRALRDTDADDGLKERIYCVEEMLGGPSPQDVLSLALPTARLSGTYHPSNIR